VQNSVSKEVFVFLPFQGNLYYPVNLKQNTIIITIITFIPTGIVVISQLHSTKRALPILGEMNSSQEVKQG
jgi:hypothetical protein